MIAQLLADAGYPGLFLAGDRSRADAAWDGGANRAELEAVVTDETHDDLTRLLASEVLYAKAPDYPPGGWEGTLAPLYARGLALTGLSDGPPAFSGNEWGFMYAGAGDPHGVLGAHLLATGKSAVAPLLALLDDTAPMLYEGSQEATIGNAQRLRVNDAAAYYLGRLTGTPIVLHDDLGERDAEIERLRAAIV